MPPCKETGRSASFQWQLARELLLPSELVGPRFGRARKRINFNATTGIVTGVPVVVFSTLSATEKFQPDLKGIWVKGRDRRSAAFSHLERIRAYWSVPGLRRRCRFEPRLSDR